MLDAILDIIRGIIDALPGERPCEALANIALLVVGGWLLWRGGRFLGNGILGLIRAISMILSALIAFLQALLTAFGVAVGGLVLLILALMALWCALVLLGI